MVTSPVPCPLCLQDDKEYVGFATLPNQVHRKSVKKGFDFTLMVAGTGGPDPGPDPKSHGGGVSTLPGHGQRLVSHVNSSPPHPCPSVPGESGLGKSTLVNSLFLTDMYRDRKLLNAEGEGGQLQQWGVLCVLGGCRAPCRSRGAAAPVPAQPGSSGCLKPRVTCWQLPDGTGGCSKATGTPLLPSTGTSRRGFVPAGKTSPGLLGISWSWDKSGRLGTVRVWGTVPVQLQVVFELKLPKLAQILRGSRQLFDLF